MSIEEELKELILSRFKSIRSFSERANIPNSTIVNILSRGINGASVQNVIGICNVLDLDIEELVEGRLIQSTKELKVSFTAQETQSFNKYRQLDYHGKKLVDTVIDLEYERCEKEASHQQDKPIRLLTESDIDNASQQALEQYRKQHLQDEASLMDKQIL